MQNDVTSIGEARRRFAKLEQIRDEWRTAMNDLVREYDAEFTDPPIALRIHAHAGGFALRWRRRGRGSKAGGQSVFTLTSEQGRRVIEHLPRPAQRRLLDYDRRAMAMNLHASIATCTADRLRRYVKVVAILESWQQECGV
jgi:hypothetical protein